ncbi:branched-chain amino acid ABC transporter permease [Castellaniella sp.]|uniref:branched-chain amino acid ABC transporter permease n=1 Tax=Castellaniella sp. TaxID=1955812 RepID=UPI00355F00A2
MQVLFKTSYDHDINFLPYRGERIRVGIAIFLFLTVPFFLNDYLLDQLGLFLVYAIAGIGLMLLTGFTGQVSFGHGAFLAIGAYVSSILPVYGWSTAASVTAAVASSSILGALLGRSTSKMHGFYLAIATLVFSILIETVFGQADEITGGYLGLQVPAFSFFGYESTRAFHRYWIDLVFFGLMLLGAANLLRSSTGRSFVAVRDSELSARCLGINVSNVKIHSFALSAGITGLAGVLMAQHLQYVTPDTFGIDMSLMLLLMVVVGGLGTLLGCVFGAALLVWLPIWIRYLRDLLPSSIAEQPGLEPLVFGLILVLFIIFEPAGLAGRWKKTRRIIETFPYFRADIFVRQRQYLKTDRLR